MSKLAIVEEALKSRKEDLFRLKVENEALDKQIEKNAKRILECTTQLEIGQEALQFLEDVANTRRGVMKSQIEKIVSEALALIYGPSYRVELVYDVKNNRSSMEIELVRKTADGEVRTGMNLHGGGVSDTISVPLRLLVLLASRQTDRVCLLDEPWKYMDLTERIERVAEFVGEVSRRLGLQMVMCSHHEIMHSTANSAWHVADDNGKAIVKKIK